MFSFFKTLLLHDISTDIADPPEFTATLKNRSAFMNSLQYKGERTAQLQRQAYPDIKSVTVSKTPEQTFDAAEKIVAKLGWKVLNVNRSLLTIEAFDTSWILRFKDDIAIRVRNDGNGSRLDIRSMSRMGIYDFGINARRIRRFAAAFHKEL